MLNYQRVSTNVTKRRSLCDWLIFWGAQQADAFTWRATGRGVCTSGRAWQSTRGVCGVHKNLRWFNVVCKSCNVGNMFVIITWVICLTLYLCKSCGRGYINHVFKHITHVKCVDILDINVKALYTYIKSSIYIYIDGHICYVCCMYIHVTLVLSLLVLLLSLLLLLVIIVITVIIVIII